MSRPEFEDIPVTPRYAVAALRWGASEEDVDYSNYRAAVDNVVALASNRYSPIAPREVLAAVRRHVPAPGTVIHGRITGPGEGSTVGQYWLAEDAIARACEPGAECAWTDGAYFHDLRVTAPDGTIAWFHAFCPERFAVTNPARRERLHAEIAQRLEF